jgi:hypothetical protein
MRERREARKKSARVQAQVGAEVYRLVQKWPEAWDYGKRIADVMLDTEPGKEFQASLKTVDSKEWGSQIAGFANELLRPMGAANMAWASSSLEATEGNYEAFSYSFRLQLLLRTGQARHADWPGTPCEVDVLPVLLPLTLGRTRTAQYEFKSRHPRWSGAMSGASWLVSSWCQFWCHSPP